ncbi:MAG: radical SAM protein [Gemmatimonadota bacterium]|nr:radical SAM protein [Gemmatimonadota bacterium]
MVTELPATRTEAVQSTNMSFLLVTPFPFKSRNDYVTNIDGIISRHSGSKAKHGVCYPTGLAYISSILKQNGFETYLIDPQPQNYSLSEIERYANLADVILIPISHTRYDDITSWLRLYKDKIRIGVSNFASICSDELLKSGSCDIVIQGENEYTCLELAKAFKVSTSPDLSKIAGISFLKNGIVFNTVERPLPKNLDRIPFPDRQGLNLNVYTDIAFRGSPTAFVLTARGCVYKCTFCSTHQMYDYKAYYRSPENVVNEIEEVIHKYGITSFFFIDDTFTLLPRRVERICDLIVQRNLGIQWACLGRIDLINDDMLMKMKRAGCIEIRFGIESGDDQILMNIRKNLTVSQVELGIQLMRKHKMRYSLFFMIGNPGETRNSIRRTIRFSKKLNASIVSFNISTPLPGSPLFDLYKEKIGKDQIKTFDTLSTDFSFCELPPKVLRRYLIFAYVSYYFRPAFLFQCLFEMISRPREIFKTTAFFLRQAMVILK